MYKHLAALLIAVLLAGTQTGCDFEILLPEIADGVVYVAEDCPDCYDTVYVEDTTYVVEEPLYVEDTVYVEDTAYSEDTAYVQDTYSENVVAADTAPDGYDDQGAYYEEDTYTAADYAANDYAGDQSYYDQECYDADGDGYCDE